MKVKRSAVLIVAVVALAGILTWFFTRGGGLKTEIFAKNGIAIKGYDVVAFFDEQQAVQGREEFSFHLKDVTWLFDSQANLSKFKQNPELYIPQFGGYCAYGMSQGYKAKTEIDTWTVLDGRLYFNYSQDVKKTWMEEKSELIPQAEGNWSTVEHLQPTK